MTGQKVYPGVYGDFKWLKKVFEAQVLKVSGKFFILFRFSGYLLLHVSLCIVINPRRACAAMVVVGSVVCPCAY